MSYEDPNSGSAEQPGGIFFQPAQPIFEPVDETEVATEPARVELPDPEDAPEDVPEDEGESEDGESEEEQPENEGYDPADHTVAEVKDYLEKNPGELAAVLVKEKAGDNRKGILDLENDES